MQCTRASALRLPSCPDPPLGLSLLPFAGAVVSLPLPTPICVVAELCRQSTRQPGSSFPHTELKPGWKDASGAGLNRRTRSGQLIRRSIGRSEFTRLRASAPRQLPANGTLHACVTSTPRRSTQRPRYNITETSVSTPILMFLSPRNNEPPEDIQQLINDSSATAGPSPPAGSDDMESGSGGASSSSSRTSTAASDKRALVHSGAEVEPTASSSHGGGSWSWASRYFSLPFLVLAGVTASLVILPLVLPPLPPPPSMRMLVPVAMLVLLLVLAFMPTSSAAGRISGAGQTYL